MLSAAVVVPKKTYVVFMVAKETVFKGDCDLLTILVKSVTSAVNILTKVTDGTLTC